MRLSPMRLSRSQSKLATDRTTDAQVASVQAAQVASVQAAQVASVQAAQVDSSGRSCLSFCVLACRFAEVDDTAMDTAEVDDTAMDTAEVAQRTTAAMGAAVAVVVRGCPGVSVAARPFSALHPLRFRPRSIVGRCVSLSSWTQNKTTCLYLFDPMATAQGSGQYKNVRYQFRRDNSWSFLIG